MTLLTSTEQNPASPPGYSATPSALSEKDFQLSEAAAGKAFKRLLVSACGCHKLLNSWALAIRKRDF